MKSFKKSLAIVLPALIILIIITKFVSKPNKENSLPVRADTAIHLNDWRAPDIRSLPASEQSNLILYGRELISNTAHYLGPKGTVAAISNGMNCQNCHLNAGSTPYSNCLSAVAANFPVFRPRSGKIESIEFRINDCLQRSLNGKPIDSLSKEMIAMKAYIKWLGKDVRKGVKPKGAGSEELTFLQRAADPAKGRVLYIALCQSCHGKNGEGVIQQDSSAFIYPPLWGSKSYNNGAGLYRLTKFAAYIKNSMPFGVSHDNPRLTDEEAWDLAAFINSQSRPVKFFPEDWPKNAMKSIDYPYGPYTDSFSEHQHKFGPFGPIKQVYAGLNKK